MNKAHKDKEFFEEIYNTTFIGLRKFVMYRCTNPAYLNVGNHDFQLSRSYRGDDKYILLSISSFSDEGKFSIFADETENILFEKKIGEFYVVSYKNKEDILAFFQDEQFMYSIETNIGEKELEKFILEIK